MGHTLTVRLPQDLAEWLREVSAEAGVPQVRIVRDLLEKARAGNRSKRYMRLAGSVRGAHDLSHRNGFTR